MHLSSFPGPLLLVSLSLCISVCLSVCLSLVLFLFCPSCSPLSTPLFPFIPMKSLFVLFRSFHTFNLFVYLSVSLSPSLLTFLLHVPHFILFYLFPHFLSDSSSRSLTHPSFRTRVIEVWVGENLEKIETWVDRVTITFLSINGFKQSRAPKKVLDPLSVLSLISTAYVI